MSKSSLVVVGVKAESLIPEINANHRECTKSGMDALRHAQQAGELLWKLKEAVKHGQFMQLIEQRCDFSVSTAQGYMKISTGLPKVLEKHGKEAPSQINITGAKRLITRLLPQKRRKEGHQRIDAPTGGDTEPSQPPAPKEPEHVPADEILDKTEAGKAFKKLSSLIGEMIRLCDDLKPHFPSKEHEAIANSLEIASTELYEWRKKWRKMKVVG